MNAANKDDQIHVEPKGERELVTTRTFNAPPRIVFKTWSEPDLFKQWWVPKSMGMVLLSCDMDIRVGGKYRLEFKHPQGGDQPIAFFGQYKEVTPPKKLVWTNEESPDSPLTTVTFEDKGEKTFLTLHELYPSKEARDNAFQDMPEGMGETFDQLDAFLLTM